MKTMKKTYLLMLCFGIMLFANAQQKETALTTIGGMKVKINLNSATSLATITMVGPSTKWISIGLGTSSMSVNKDVNTYGTSLLDQYFTTSGHVVPTTDATNNLTLVSNTVTGTSRTVIYTRPFNTGDAKDYAFVYTITSLNIVWGIGPSTTVTSEHSTFGSKTLTFSTVLGVEDYTTLSDISVYPNPSNGVFTIAKNSLTPVTKISIYDMNAKLLKVISTEITDQNNTIDLTELSKGMYFMELANEADQVVKKIVIN
jgi:Secretion system C-terminal sorting domain/DOMON domain